MNETLIKVKALMAAHATLGEDMTAALILDVVSEAIMRDAALVASERGRRAANTRYASKRPGSTEPDAVQVHRTCDADAPQMQSTCSADAPQMQSTCSADAVHDAVPGPLTTISDQRSEQKEERDNVSLAGNALVLSVPKAPKQKKPKPAPDYLPEFERIWADTGRSGNKLPAFDAWCSVGRPIADAVIAGWRHAERFDKRWPAFIPHLSSWLNVRGWEDRPNDRRGGAAHPPAPSSFEEIQARDREERERRRLAEESAAKRAAEVRAALSGGMP